MKRRIRVYIGKLLFVLGRHMPVAHFIIRPIGRFAKWYRQICGVLICEKCGKNVNIYPLSNFDSSLEIGNNSDIGYKANIQGKCIIGNDVIMGPECNIWTKNHKYEDLSCEIKYQGVSEEKKVEIKDGCWIGSRVTILPGVIIGKGVVVGACSVVTKNIPDYAIVVGNPARIIKYRK